VRRDDWLDLARKVDWTPRYVTERELFPEEISGSPWLAHDAWRDWNEAYRTTYREYVANQREKDAAVLGVRAALSKPRLFDQLDPGWVELVKFHNGAVTLAEYAGAVAELRMARFGRDSAWRTMSTLGALDEIRHTQIPLLIGHDLMAYDGNFDWTHKAYHTNEWVILAARHLFDDMMLAADAIDLAIQLNFVFETGFTSLQFMAMAAMADRAHHHLRRAMPRSGIPCWRHCWRTARVTGLSTSSTRCGGDAGGCSWRSAERPWSISPRFRRGPARSRSS
jgi:toluene monooxygenase system protein A